MSHAGFFVTGTDTGVGKTLVSAALVHAYGQAGRRVAGMKPVASGAVDTAAGQVWEDVEQIMAEATVPVAHALVNPYHFVPPVAPHLAAAMAHEAIDLERILAAYTAVCRQAELVVVEGVGGFMVPLNATEDTSTLARRLGLPVILVVGMRLGCINHALLTAAAIEAQGLSLAGWVANTIEPDMPLFQENVASLVARLKAPLLGVIPHFSGGATAAQAATSLALPPVANLSR